jgi:predicted phage tail protein
MKGLRVVGLSLSLGAMLAVSNAAHATATAELSWSAPTTRENGQALAVSDLSGYEIYYTTDDPKVTGTVKVSGGSSSSYTIQNLAPGTYHFAMAAVDASGLKSKLSPVVDYTLVSSTSAATPGSPTGFTAAVSSKSIKLNWTPPTTRTDGTALAAADLSGYAITVRPFGGTTGAALSASVSGGSIRTYTMSNIATGFYAVYVAAVDKAGKQSSTTYQLVTVP